MSALDAVLGTFQGPTGPESTEAATERAAVRRFLAEAAAVGLFQSQCDGWLSGHCPELSAELGRRGWIGMTWPAVYGGRAASTMARFAVVEELLAAGAPVAAHWFADRQVGPSLLRHGTPAQQNYFLPPMARGELFFCVGMSEPDSGSDLGSVRTRAVRDGDAWRVSGTKVWTSHADKAHFMLALVRTGSTHDKPSEALTQMLIRMDTSGVTVRPIQMLDGRPHFCEVTLDEVLVPDDAVLGRVGKGWHQVLGELAFERSGPERFLSTFPMFGAIVEALDDADGARDADVGSIIARLSVLRTMSAHVNQNLDGSQAQGVAAAIVKELGTTLENDSVDVARRWMHQIGDDRIAEIARWFYEAQTHAPGFTLRGGTSEIMRGIIARALGVS